MRIMFGLEREWREGGGEITIIFIINIISIVIIITVTTTSTIATSIITKN